MQPSKTSPKKYLKHYLSKSLFMRGYRCHRALWLQKYHPEQHDETSDELEEAFEAGIDFGEQMQSLFPGGVEIPYDDLSLDDQVAMTQFEIEKGTGTIYEAAFWHDTIFCRVDILRRNGNEWELYEVKLTDTVKEFHCYDAGLQFLVLTGAGYAVSRVCIVHPDHQKVMEASQPGGLITDITSQVISLLPNIRKEIAAQRTMLSGALPAADSCGKKCHLPYPCDFMNACRLMPG